jgi:hypothetical protein
MNILVNKKKNSINQNIKKKNSHYFEEKNHEDNRLNILLILFYDAFEHI